MKITRKFIKEHKWLAITICIVFALTPIGIYSWNFRSFVISDDPVDWGVFGDYIGGIYGGFFTCIITVLAIYLARALAKKDQKKEKQIKAAEVLYNQITTIENNNYNRNSIEKLKRDIHSNELYISKDLCNDMISLADQFLEQKDGTGTINIELNESVKLQLKELYGQ